ncbi:DUF4233 domain-containing protein [Gandjariella thermophila]|nr:DUF4233 domain-containing protein [Gandjariella thermophila]
MTDGPERPAAPRRDPWRSFRAVQSGILVIEAIVVALALLVVARLGGGLGSVAGGVVLALVAALLVTSGLVRFRWGLWVAVALQVALIGCVVLQTALGFIGVVFALVWGYVLWVRRDVARRLAAGRLPGQQPPAS